MTYNEIKEHIQQNPKLFLHFAKTSGYTDKQIQELKKTMWSLGINPNRGSNLPNSYMKMKMTLQNLEYESFGDYDESRDEEDEFYQIETTY